MTRRLVIRISERLTSQIELRLELDRLQKVVSARTPGSPASSGYKIYSQCDEDGIIDSIFTRIGEGGKTFVEIGASDGLENNTHALLLRGWRGVWVDADKIKVKYAKQLTIKNSNIHIIQAFVYPDNAHSIVASAMQKLGINELDFLSIDIDGQDLSVIRQIVDRNLRPRVLCVEYNAKFRPPLKVCADTDGMPWTGDDYQGASLCSFVEALGTLGYVLVACSLSGVNAFFIREPEAAVFPRFGASELYQPARYELRYLRSGHPASLKFIRTTRTDAPAARVIRGREDG